MIENVVGLLRADLQQKNIVIRRARNDALPRVLSDAVQLQQVVLNLLINASEAMKEIVDRPRTISVDTDEPRPGLLILSVRDNGIGVKEPEELERMFEHFAGSKPEGLGMGLAISRAIVEAHGGRIWASTNSGPGLTLNVEFPALAEARAEAR